MPDEPRSGEDIVQAKKGEKKRIRPRVVPSVLWAAAVCWIAFCFFLSWQSGPDTAELSGGLTAFLVRIFRAVGIPVQAAHFHMLLRKTAHVGVFLIAAVLLESAFLQSLWLLRRAHRGRNAALGAFAVCSAAAWIAEGVKLWIPGRHFDLGETLLNEVGVIGGVLAVQLVCLLWRRRKARKAQETQEEAGQEKTA